MGPCAGASGIVGAALWARTSLRRHPNRSPATPFEFPYRHKGSPVGTLTAMPPKPTARQAKIDALLAEWSSWQRFQGLSQRTITEREAFMRRYFHHTNEDSLKITAPGILKYFERLEESRGKALKPGGRWAYAQHLRAYSLWLIRTGKRDDDPMQKLPTIKKPPGMPKPIPEQELGKLLHAAGEPARMMILLGAFAGLRISEIARVHGANLDRSTGMLTVIGKGDKPALLKLHPIVLDAARDYPVDGWWFPKHNRQGEPMDEALTREAAAAVIRRAAAVAGVTVSPHQLRHRFGTVLLRQTLNIRTVQELMRHANVSSTQIYTKVTNEQLDAAIDSLTFPTAGD